jgi:hypothetical protein
MSIMGERFLLFRMPAMDELKQANRAMLHVSQEDEMRRELRGAVSTLFDSIFLETREFDEPARVRMAALATLVARARSAVERDGYHRDIELIPGSEMPGRLARSLRCLFQGLENIGVGDAEAWALVCQTGLDCIPDVRHRALTCLAQQAQPVETGAIAEVLSYPLSTTRRVLEDLTAHGLVERFGDGSGSKHRWTISSRSKELTILAQVTL